MTDAPPLTQDVPFATEIMGLLAWVVLEDGSVLGPVGPIGMVMMPEDNGFALHLRFVLNATAEGIKSYVQSAHIQVAEVTRTPAVPRDPVWSGDRYVMTYTMHANWGD